MSPISTSAFETEPSSTSAPGPEPQNEEAPKARRRTKAELIDAAVVPGDQDAIKLKDKSTGAKVERPWVVAVQLVGENKAEFVDKSLKYAVLKMEQQGERKQDDALVVDTEGQPMQVSSEVLGPEQSDSFLGLSHRNQDWADGLEGRWEALQEEIDETKASDTDRLTALAEEAELVRKQLIDAGYEDVQSDDAYNRRNFMVGDDRKIPSTGGDAVDEGAPEAKSANIPPDAEVGDEVRIGSDTLRVGHGGVLTTSPVADGEGNPIKAKNRWQRELGSGKGGPWERTMLGIGDAIKQIDFQAPSEDATDKVTSEVTQVGADVQPLSTGGWRVSAGYLEKIGLPEYSSIQIGPVIVSRDVSVIDESDRISVTREDGSVISAPRAVVDAQRGCFHAAEISMRYERGAFLAFLEAARSKG
jgi:hypothetical protein